MGQMSEEEKSQLSQRRGRLAVGVVPEKRQAFIAAQGKVDKAGGKDIDYAQLNRATEDEATSQAVKDALGESHEFSNAPYSMATDQRKKEE